MKKSKKILSIFLALLMLVMSVPLAFAQDEPVNSDPDLSGLIKIPASPEGLNISEKWMDFGSAIAFIVVDGVFDSVSFVSLMINALLSETYYFNETTQELFSLNESGELHKESSSLWYLRSIGDEQSAALLPSVSDGLAPGRKWFNLTDFYLDLVAQYTPEDDELRAYWEASMSMFATASMYLSSDGSTVYAKGYNARVGELLKEVPDDQQEEFAILNGGNWFINLNRFIESDERIKMNAFDYVKTVESGECIHVWNDGVRTKEPTCTAVGTKTFTCTNGCGATREEIIPALGHDWDGGKVDKKPTITETGICIYTCNRCKTTKTVTVSKTDPTSLLNDLKNKHNLRDNADDATVFFDAGANLPADTVFNYEIIAQSKFLQIFDLTLTSGGKKIEPEAPVWVKLPIPQGWNPNWISVWHGNEELPSFADGGYIYFLTTHFSEFQVKYDEQNQEENKPDNSGNNDNTNTQPSGKVCKYCGEVHNGFFQKIIGFFHSILALFGLKKK